MFEDFARHRIDVGGIEINSVLGGSGPPVLLLHGYPQNLAEWARLAPLLADRYTVVCADLRGYGDSAKPEAGDDVGVYSFRAMAADQVGLMRELGFDAFHVVGHDRGGRVAHRMALDRPHAVRSLTVLDLVPTTSLYLDVDRHLAATYWQWYFLPQPPPLPERLIGADPDFYFEHCLVSNGGAAIDRFHADQLASYRRCWNDPAMIRASCDDYRAGIGVDLQADIDDLDARVTCPTLALWAADGLMRRHFDIGEVWKQRCTDVRTGTVPGGHFFPEQEPDATAAALHDFLRG